MQTVMWAVVASLAVLWPSRLIGPIDGAPLDQPLEAILLGMVLPLAWILSPRVFHAAPLRVASAALLIWKLGTWFLLAQQGLCATFAVHTGLPDHTVLRRAWDFRTAADGLPQCSAVLTRNYEGRGAFPAWFLNLPVGRDYDLDRQARRYVELPPEPQVSMFVHGYRRSSDGADHIAEARHFAGEQWSYALPPREGWLSRSTVTVTPPRRLDTVAAAFWPVTPLLTVRIVAYSVMAAATRLALRGALLGTVVGATAVGLVLGTAGDPYARATGLLVAAVALFAFRRNWVSDAPRLVCIIGVPFLATIAALSASHIGHVTIYSAGDDWQTFQRYAGRIYFEGFWLEGGERTFWQQPLYRWIAGALHVVFGDSSVGETYWDAFGVIAATMFACALTMLVLPRAWGVAAAVLTLLVMTLGPTWYLIGRGLSEITGGLWLALAAFALIKAQRGDAVAAGLAGLFAVLAVYTRLNHLILVLAMLVLLAPATPAAGWHRLRAVAQRIPMRSSSLYLAIIVAGLLLFMMRTWYYTGHFSLLYGTTRHFNSTGLGFDTIADPVVWRRVIDSVLMVVLVADPPRLDPRTLVVLFGVTASGLALLGVPRFRDIPLAPAVLCLAAISSAFVARGMAYPGRFSVHLIPLAVAVALLATARLTGRPQRTVWP